MVLLDALTSRGAVTDLRNYPIVQRVHRSFVLKFDPGDVTTDRIIRCDYVWQRFTF